MAIVTQLYITAYCSRQRKFELPNVENGERLGTYANRGVDREWKKTKVHFVTSRTFRISVENPRFKARVEARLPDRHYSLPFARDFPILHKHSLHLQAEEKSFAPLSPTRPVQRAQRRNSVRSLYSSTIGFESTCSRWLTILSHWIQSYRGTDQSSTYTDSE